MKRISKITRGALVATITAFALAMLTACGTAGGDASNGSKNPQTIGEKGKKTEATTEGGNTQLANPWHEASEEEAAGVCAHVFKLPAGATDVTWRVMDQNVDHAMVEAIFECDDMAYRARAQESDNGEEDISGLYLGGATKDVTLSVWDVTAHQCIFYGEDDSPDENCLIWYDAETKTNYSLEASGHGASKVDILKVAAEMK